MKPTYHIIASAGISLGIQATTHSWPATLGCFFSGVLIDVDHYVEYCLFRKTFPFRYQDLLDFLWDTRETKQYLIFHAYEYLFLFWSLIYLLHLGLVWIGIAIGLTTHLLFDQWTNPIKPLYYFLIFRMNNQFQKERILTEQYFKESVNQRGKV